MLEGNGCGYGANLARHLLNLRDNDHVTVYGVEGFVSDDVARAFAEAEAISSGTKYKNCLFVLSLNPPPDAQVPVAMFEDTIASVEKRLGLEGQPRAVMFHEKNGRRHAPAVWSRIYADTMTAINLPHCKRKLVDLSRDLYHRHDWEMPAGFRKAEDRDPLNYSRAEAGQAARLKRDPKAQKAMFRACWDRSDGRAGFEAALRQEGYVLDRRELDRQTRFREQAQSPTSAQERDPRQRPLFPRTPDIQA
ncbi:MAG: hypothetical protein AAGE03_15960 [Pseudomonadota bacterium]